MKSYGRCKMIYITGDTHGDFHRFNRLDLNDEDIMIILGDVGINYYLDEYDKKLKERLSKYNFKFFCIQGNHEERPENISSYREVEMFGGQVYIEDEYPNLIFAKNGELYNLNGKNILVIGGAYSIDKDYRISKGYPWFKNEQLSELERKSILEKYTGKHADIILSHTCPFKYEPKESFKLSLPQELVDKSMENFLNEIEDVNKINELTVDEFTKLVKSNKLISDEDAKKLIESFKKISEKKNNFSDETDDANQRKKKYRAQQTNIETSQTQQQESKKPIKEKENELER